MRHAEHVLGTVVRCATQVDAPAAALWGVAVPGPFDYDKGIARFEGVGKFDDLYGVDVGSVLLDGVWPRPRGAVFLNDAHAFALGEWSAGAARGHRRCVGVTLGTGVGSAFLVDGRVVHEGPGVPPLGRIDLVTAHGRPLEESVSRRALLARYGDRRAEPHDIAARARAGEARAGRVLHEALTTLGTVLAPYVRTSGPRHSWWAGPLPVLGPRRARAARRVGGHPGHRRRGRAGRGRGARGGRGVRGDGVRARRRGYGRTEPSGHVRSAPPKARQEREERVPYARTTRLRAGQPPTLRDVAERAGVSAMTASRVLRDDPRVLPRPATASARRRPPSATGPTRSPAASASAAARAWSAWSSPTSPTPSTRASPSASTPSSRPTA
ncbi:hypothetical protein SMD44_08466 [Streptomyces alboflavus]|uniref:HTH lacI-type domain-containing protein n=1 Tax=Streptomyces alboflavus TaxID=67267 RepID=A0A1Z1WRF7_9ACTN|nr:hypothetical protein SMD44_08466 [Streptomyces alboflavus]